MATFTNILSGLNETTPPLYEDGVAGELLLVGELCYYNTDGKWYKATHTDVDKCSTELRVTMQGIFPNESGTFIAFGDINVAVNHILVPGEKYYVGSNLGTFTNVKPTNGDHYQRYVGTARNSSVLIFNPDATYIKVDGSTVDGLHVGDGLQNIVEDITPELGGDLDALDNNIVNISNLKLNTSAGIPAYNEGLIFYDNSKNALSYYNENSQATVNLGQELIFPVVNNSGSTINNGDVISPDSTGITLADRKIKEKSRLIAVATTTMLNGESGYATRLGQVGGLDTSSYSSGQILYLGNNGQYSTTPPMDGEYSIIIGVVDVVDASEGIITVDINISDLTVEVTDTNGFPTDQRESTTLSVVEGTRTFTISPEGSDFHFYVLGNKFEKTISQSIVFDDIEGEHWFYFDINGVLQTITNPSEPEAVDIVGSQCFVAYLYWNATDNKIEFDIHDERHGISMSPATHLYLHRTRGAQYLSGFSTSDLITDASGDVDSHAQFSVTSGRFADEDLEHESLDFNIGDSIDIAYLDGPNGNLRTVTNGIFPVLSAPAGRLYYNEWTGTTWQLTEITNNDFVLCHIFAVNGNNKHLMSVMGQADYTNISQARAGANTEISNIIAGFAVEEAIPIATIIYQTSNGYANGVMSRVRTTDTGEDYIDWRITELAQGASPTSHDNLTNLELAGTGIAYGHISDQDQTIDGFKQFIGGAQGLNSYISSYNSATSRASYLDNGDIKFTDDSAGFKTIYLKAPDEFLGSSVTFELPNKSTGIHTLALENDEELLTAGENLTQGDLCYINTDGKVYKTIATDAGKVKGILVISFFTTNAETESRMLLKGTFETTGLILGSEYFIAETSGIITNDISAFSSGSTIRSLGYAISTTKLKFNPSNEYYTL